ncbi:MAG: hypothetical protein K2Q03_00165 [Sphingobacteriaceae bacterium]|nr:hypothetical protein [Sphingobacteriaceae bacterium]
MLKSLNKTQIIFIAAIILLVGFLFSRDIKGLVKEEENTAAAQPSNTNQNINLQEVSATAKNLISNTIAKEITNLEQNYAGASGAEKINLAKSLAKKWDDVAQDGPSAFYFEEIAKSQPSLNNWLTTGNRFLSAFENSKDSLMQSGFLQKANIAYSTALTFDKNDISSQIGLATTIVNGIGAPMQGITMLLEIVKKEPNNIKANMNLGMFAMKSGQFDKAVDRFNKIIAYKESPEAYFYLATAYESLGKNNEAINAYTKSKKLAANPTLTSFIEKKLAELKK